MKLSTGMIGTLLFTAVATAAFVWMVKRPAVDGNAMIFGMPTSSAVVEEKIEDKMPEATEATTSTSMPATEPATLIPEAEPAKVEETTTMPASSAEPVVPASTEAETKPEEMPATEPTAN